MAKHGIIRGNDYKAIAELQILTALREFQKKSGLNVAHIHFDQRIEKGEQVWEKVTLETVKTS